MSTRKAAAVTREEIQSERARWRPSARGRPRARPAADPAAPSVIPLARAWTPEDYGRPSVAHRVGGYPLEVRVWTRRPEGVAGAIYHPSGVWIALRVL